MMGRSRLVVLVLLLLAGALLFTTFGSWSSSQPTGRSKILPGYNKQFNARPWDSDHLPSQADSLFDFDGDALNLRNVLTNFSVSQADYILPKEWEVKHTTHRNQQNDTAKADKEQRKKIYTYEQILQEQRAALTAEKEQLEAERHHLEVERNKLEKEREIWQNEKLRLKVEQERVAAMRTQLDAALKTNANQVAQEEEEETRKELELKLISDRRQLDAEKRRLEEDKKRVEEHLNQIRDLHSDMEGVNGKKLASAKKSNWEGLDSIDVNRRYPGIVFLPDFTMDHLLTEGQVIEDVHEAEAEDRFYDLVTTNAIECKEVQRMGNTGDGGWDVCISKPYFPRRSCIIYSFGINNDWSFDEAMEDQFGCQVYSFDPSMNMKDHMHTTKIHFYQLGLGGRDIVSPDGWKLRTLSTIQKQLKHSNKIIDIIKIDIEHNEWRSFRTLASDGSLTNVKQLVFEIHTREVYPISQTSSKQDFYNMWNALYKLEKLGFRQFHYHFNPYAASHFHPLQVVNCYSNSPLVVDEDDNGKLRLERVMVKNPSVCLK